MMIGMLIGVANAVFAIFFSVWWATVIRIGLNNLQGTEKLHWYNGNCLLYIACLLIMFLLFSWLMAEFVQACNTWQLPKIAMYLTASFIVATGIWSLFSFLIPNLVATAGGDFALQEHGELLLMLWLGSMYFIGGVYAGGQKFLTMLLFPLIVLLLVTEKSLISAGRIIKSYRDLLDASKRGGGQS